MLTDKSRYFEKKTDKKFTDEAKFSSNWRGLIFADEVFLDFPLDLFSQMTPIL